MTEIVYELVIRAPMEWTQTEDIRLTLLELGIDNPSFILHKDRYIVIVGVKNDPKKLEILQRFLRLICWDLDASFHITAAR